MTVRAYLLRGVLAGLLVGLIVGVLAFIGAEPVIDHAINIESQRVSSEYHQALNQAIIQHHGDIAAARRDVPAPDPEVFSRQTQHLGLIVATTLFAVGIGGIFAVVFLVMSRRATPRSVWQRSLLVGGSLLLALYLIPFIRYPANPPGVGDPATIDRRTLGYTLAIAISATGVWAARRLALYLRERGLDEAVRHLAAAGAIIVTIALEFLLLPDNTDPLPVPAGLLWDFRLRALGVQVLLWGGIAVVFALLTQRAIQRSMSHQRGLAATVDAVAAAALTSTHG